MEHPTVEITQGKLVGTTSTDLDGATFYSFRGIPFGKAPTGYLRFKAPLPAEPWQGVLDATKNGPCSLQFDLARKEFIGSEDCLNLNVYTPSLPGTTKELLPVMVWIHGGGFNVGSNNSNLYGPQFLMTGNVVLVAINYRLGLLGFLGFSDPRAGAPGNAGFKDMVLALKWVQANIKQFGGDPNNVTVFGQSTGGASAHILSLSPMTEGLIHKVIAQSGCALNPFVTGKVADEETFRVFGHEGKSDLELVEYLRSSSAESIVEAQYKVIVANNIGPNTIRIRGLVLEKPKEEQNEEPFMVENPIDILLSGRFKNIPTIFGFTDLEGFFVNSYRPKRFLVTLKNFELNLPHYLGYKLGSPDSRRIARTVKEFYFGKEEPKENLQQNIHNMFTDHSFLHGIFNSVRLHAMASKSSVFFYQMSLHTSLAFQKPQTGKRQTKGAAHGDDVAYLFKTKLTPVLEKNFLEYISIRRFVELWTNFARYGNPTPDDCWVKWKPATAGSIGYLDIDKEFVFRSKFEHEGLAFWNGIFANSPKGKDFAPVISKF